MQEDQTDDNQTEDKAPVVSAVPPQPPRKRITLPNFWQAATVLLLIAVAVMAFMWKPWEPNIKASERTISVTGNATVSATPDQYQFSPYYRFTNTDKQTGLSEMTSKSNEIVKHLKSLGVADKDIKTNSGGYNNYYATSDGKTTYTLSLTVTVDDSKLAQKVQDYLLTTGPTGTVSPYVSFSKAKEQQLQDKARDKAEKNARDKADQSAKNLGFKVDTVKSVKDGTLGGISPYYGAITQGANSATDRSSTPHLNLQPGQNDLSYSVDVVYYIH